VEPKLKLMNLWTLPLSLPRQTWVPLGLSALAPLVLMAVLIPLSRRRERGIATVFALRIAVVLGFGFATLATVATVAVVRTGLTELHRRRVTDVRTLAQTIERGRFGPTGAEALLQLGLFRAKDVSVGFVAIGDQGCRAVCVVNSGDKGATQADLRKRLKSAWPNPADNGYILSIGERPYLLVASAVRDPAGRRAATIVAGFDAAYLVDQATRAAWMVVTISYVLLVIVGWNAWRQLHDSLATRIRAITMQLRLGIADDAAPTLRAEGHELKDLADSVSNYIRQTLDQQQSNEERYRRLIELAPDGVLICSDAGVRFANPAAIALAGVKRRLDLIGLPIDKFLEFENVESAGHHTDGGLRPALWRRLSGEQLHVEVAEVSYVDSGVSIRQYVVRDVTSRRAREAALAHRAEHDSLTGLVNRARFQARLAEMLSTRAVPFEPADVRKAAVLFIDLDGFKPINDRAGHAAGDAVLVAVAARLRESTRGTDLVARFGGDEFAVLIEVREPTEVLTVAKRILRSLRQPIRYENNLLTVRASIGIANSSLVSETEEGSDAPIDGASAAADLLRAADIAMYVAKTNGGDRYAHAGEWTESPDEDSDVNFHAVA
jgi:diguanylate cyclase (GGDEF)-like protein/PAS domain S-box-containing protein